MPEPEAPVQGNPEPQTPTTPDPASGEQGQPTETPEMFSDTFDPASLDDALRPAYKQMRDAFSQKTQSIAEERRQLREAKELHDALQDPDRQLDALRKLGIEFEDDEDDYQEPQTELEQRLAALENQLAQSQQTAQEAQLEQAEHAYVVDGLQKLATRTGREFDDDELDTIGHLSTVLRDSEGFPDVDAAYERIYATVLPKERERWKSQKQSPQAPSGASAAEVPDLDTPAGRAAYMQAKLAQGAAE